MQLKFMKDFLFRRATSSDRSEILALIRNFGDSRVADVLEARFAETCADQSALFEVFLNSNGVIIALVYGNAGELVEIAANPNFLKPELRTALYSTVKEWSEKTSSGMLESRPKLISGDWKTFFKKQGASIETKKNPDGMRDCIRFS